MENMSSFTDFNLIQRSLKVEEWFRETTDKRRQRRRKATIRAQELLYTIQLSDASIRPRLTYPSWRRMGICR